MTAAALAERLIAVKVAPGIAYQRERSRVDYKLGQDAARQFLERLPSAPAHQLQAALSELHRTQTAASAAGFLDVLQAALARGAA